jgi:hypothetical protein
MQVPVRYVVHAANTNLTLPAAQVQALLDAGICWTDGQQRIHSSHTSAQLGEWSIAHGIGVCDFCSGQPIVARYGCVNFTGMGSDGRPMKFFGDWVACADCERFIDARQFSLLSAHCAAAHCKRIPRSRIAKTQLRQRISILHRQFAHHATGEKRAI